MRILIVLKGGASSVEGEVVETDMGKMAEWLTDTKEDFILLDKTPHGMVIINKSAIGYIRKAQ